MDFALNGLVESVSATDAALTREFYAARPHGSAIAGYDELIAVRHERSLRFAGSVRAEAESADLAGHAVPVRIIEPQQRPAVGVLLHCPGGGFYMSSAVADDERNARRADSTGLAVVTVDSVSRRNTRGRQPRTTAAQPPSGSSNARQSASERTGSSSAASRRERRWRRASCCGCGQEDAATLSAERCWRPGPTT